jgi:hypothetical protein
MTAISQMLPPQHLHTNARHTPITDRLSRGRMTWPSGTYAAFCLELMIQTFLLAVVKINHDSRPLAITWLTATYPATTQLLPRYYPATTQPAATTQLLPSYYPATTQLLSSYYPATTQLLPSCYPATTQLLSSYCPASIQLLPSSHPATTHIATMLLVHKHLVRIHSWWFAPPATNRWSNPGVV